MTKCNCIAMLEGLKSSRHNGYLRVNGGKYRRKYQHRAVIEILNEKGPLRQVLPPDYKVHHQNGDATDNRPCNLVVCPKEFNPPGNGWVRNPLGQFTTTKVWGDLQREGDGVPDWVTEDGGEIVDGETVTE